MQAARRIHDEQVGVAGLGGLNAVEHHAGGVRALLVAHDGAARAVGPDLQLLGGGGAEGIGRAEDDRAAKPLKAQGELADGGGLAHAVDAHHERHHGPVQGGLFHLQHLHQNALERLLGLGRIAQVLRPDALAQAVDGLGGAGRAHIAQDQRVQQIVVKILIDGAVVLNGGLHRHGHMLAAFKQPFLQAGKQALFFGHGKAPPLLIRNRSGLR